MYLHTQYVTMEKAFSQRDHFSISDVYDDRKATSMRNFPLTDC